MFQENREAIRNLTTLVAQDVDNMRSLARIAEAHEHRLGRIEGQQYRGCYTKPCSLEFASRF